MSQWVNRQIDKSANWQIDKLTSWQIGELTNWQIGELTNYKFSLYKNRKKRYKSIAVCEKCCTFAPENKGEINCFSYIRFCG